MVVTESAERHSTMGTLPLNLYMRTWSLREVEPQISQFQEELEFKPRAHAGLRKDAREQRLGHEPKGHEDLSGYSFWQRWN
jgi:hypothetical protein